MAYGLEFKNTNNRVLVSADFVQPYFFQKKTGSISANSGVAVDTGVPIGEDAPIVYLACHSVSSNPTNITDFGPAIYRTYKGSTNWTVSLHADVKSGSNYELYVFRRGSYSANPTNWGLALFDENGNTTYATSDNKKLNIVAKIGSWAAVDWALDGGENTEIQNQFSVSGISKPCVNIPPPVPRYYVPPGERRPELFRYSSFAINTGNNNLCVAMKNSPNFTGTFDVDGSLSYSLGRETSGTLFMIDGADYD